jgi:hypothetical protein
MSESATQPTVTRSPAIVGGLPFRELDRSSIMVDELAPSTI